MIRNAMSVLFALIIALSFGGCGDGDSDHKVDTTEHDNWVYMDVWEDNVQVSFALSEHSITSGQPWGGVSTSYPTGTFEIDAKAGRHGSSSVASWFKSHASAATCANWPSGCPDWPSNLNFAFTGNITINGTGYPITIGQGSVGGVHNNWWIGGPGWQLKSTALGDAMITPDGKYYFEPVDDTFDTFRISTSY